MQVELGNGATHLDYYNEEKDAGNFSWYEFSRRVGKGNGCPRVQSNIKKEMHALGIGGGEENLEELAAERYTREHLPHNFWWRMLLSIAEGENPALAKDMKYNHEEVPGEDEYDVESVDYEYHFNRRRFGLAQDVAFGITSHIVEVANESPEHVFLLIDALLAFDSVEEAHASLEE